jgi:hypothetical protein
MRPSWPDVYQKRLWWDHFEDAVLLFTRVERTLFETGSRIDYHCSRCEGHSPDLTGFVSSILGAEFATILVVFDKCPGDDAFA